MVENQGRINGGSKINDPKGIIQNVTLNGLMLVNWKMAPVHSGNGTNNLSFEKPGKSKFATVTDENGSDKAGLFYGTVPPMPDGKAPQDSYLLLKGWQKVS